MPWLLEEMKSRASALPRFRAPLRWRCPQVPAFLLGAWREKPARGETARPRRLQRRGTLELFEFGCWFMVCAAPFHCWIDGPSVSADQYIYIVRIADVALAVSAGAASGCVRLVRRRGACDTLAVAPRREKL